jgi:hypothetical protein
MLPKNSTKSSSHTHAKSKMISLRTSQPSRREESNSKTMMSSTTSLEFWVRKMI